MAEVKKGSKDLLGEFAALVSEQFKEAKPIQKAITEKIDVESNATDSVQKYAEMFSRKKTVNEQQDPLVPLNQDFLTRKDLEDHYKLFISRIQTQLASIGGGGEVKFLRLDDVANQTANDNWVLEYDASTGKVQFTNEIGPIDNVQFDITHDPSEHAHSPGTLCWSVDEQTLNLYHPNDVVQQVGQEIYGYSRNRTGETIPNGTVVGFVGAEENGSSRLLIGPYLADGTQPSLYVLGVTTESIPDGADGRATVWGKVRGLDMSDFNVGDILYASTTDPGKFTNVKPTAPNNVIPVAAVLSNSDTEGEIFVRPTVELQQSYGRFARTTDQTANTVNTGYPILFDDTEITNGITIGDPTSRLVVNQSGFYQFDVSLQVSASSNKGIVYVWYRKNGVDVPYSSRRSTIVNNDTLTFNTSIQISLDANEYVEIIWATDASGITLDANATPTVGPAVASVLLSIAQIQL